MFVVRDVFKAKAGKSKDLVAKFKSTNPQFMGLGVRNIRILTDVSADFWTLIWNLRLIKFQIILIFQTRQIQIPGFTMPWKDIRT